VLIFRIETDEGKGPYQRGWCMRTIAECRRHPVPQDDSGLADFWKHCGDKDSMFFGFGTTAQMRAWFYQDSWLKTLHEEGYQLSTYEIDDEPDVHGYVHACIGNTQAVFRRDRAKLIDTAQLIDLIDPDASEWDEDCATC
jgi:hypothetical protein